MSDISSSSDTSTASTINTNGSSPTKPASEFLRIEKCLKIALCNVHFVYANLCNFLFVVDKNNLRLNLDPVFPSITDGDGVIGVPEVAVPVVEKPVKASSVSEIKIPPPSASSNKNMNLSGSSTMRPNLMLSEGAARLPTSVSTSQM